MTEHTISIDISKSHLDAFRLEDQAAGQFENTTRGIRALMLPRLTCDAHSYRPRPDQIPPCLMGRIRHPDRRQFARPMQLGQHHRVAAVGLHPVARLHWNERRCNHDAVMPQVDKLTVPAIPARPGLVAEMQPGSVSTQSLHQLPDMLRPIRNGSPIALLTPHAHLARPQRREMVAGFRTGCQAVAPKDEPTRDGEKQALFCGIQGEDGPGSPPASN